MASPVHAVCCLLLLLPGQVQVFIRRQGLSTHVGKRAIWLLLRLLLLAGRLLGRLAQLVLQVWWLHARSDPGRGAATCCHCCRRSSNRHVATCCRLAVKSHQLNCRRQDCAAAAPARAIACSCSH